MRIVTITIAIENSDVREGSKNFAKRHFDVLAKGGLSRTATIAYEGNLLRDLGIHMPAGLEYDIKCHVEGEE